MPDPQRNPLVHFAMNEVLSQIKKARRIAMANRGTSGISDFLLLPLPAKPCL
jgi:hypothetical protein